MRRRGCVQTYPNPSPRARKLIVRRPPSTWLTGLMDIRALTMTSHDTVSTP